MLILEEIRLKSYLENFQSKHIKFLHDIRQEESHIIEQEQRYRDGQQKAIGDLATRTAQIEKVKSNIQFYNEKTANLEKDSEKA